MKLWVTVCATLLTLACSAPVSTPTFEPAPMSLKIVPRFPFEGNMVQITCFHPMPNERQRKLLRLEGHKANDYPHDRMQHVLVDGPVSCGTWQVECKVYEELSGKVVERLTAPLQVRGTCDSIDPHIFGWKYMLRLRDVLHGR